jgi:hypothetical protein
LAEGHVELGHPQDFPLLGAALADVPDEADELQVSLERKRPGADLDREGAAVLAAVDGLEPS